MPVGADHLAQAGYQLINLARRANADCVGDAHPVHAHFVNCLVHLVQVFRVAAQAVLGAEAHFDILAFEILDHFLCHFNDFIDALAMAEAAQGRGGANHDIYPAHTGVQGHTSIFQVAKSARARVSARRAINMSAALTKIPSTRFPPSLRVARQKQNGAQHVAGQRPQYRRYNIKI